MDARSPDRALEDLARNQHGAFSRLQVLQLGFTPAKIRTRLQRGSWIALRHTHVYALPSHLPTWHRQCMAATLAVPGGAVAGASAAALHGFAGWPKARIEVVTTARRRPSNLAIVHQSSSVSRRLVVQGIPVVSPEDCLVQLAGRCGAERLAATVDDAVAAGTLDLEALRALAASSRAVGVGRLRQVLAERSDEAWEPSSPLLERHLRALLTTTPELPGITWQAPAPWWDRGEGRVDAVVPAWWLIVEADGRRWHSRLADFERDRWRDNQAAAHGYAVLRFTWHHLRDDLDGCRRLVVECGRFRRVEAA